MTEQEFIGLNPSEVKISYSDEVKMILDDVFVKEKLWKAHELRVRAGLEIHSNVNVIESALKMYIRHWTTRLMNREKKAKKEQSRSERGARKPEGEGII